MHITETCRLTRPERLARRARNIPEGRLLHPASDQLPHQGHPASRKKVRSRLHSEHSNCGKHLKKESSLKATGCFDLSTRDTDSLYLARSQLISHSYCGTCPVTFGESLVNSILRPSQDESSRDESTSGPRQGKAACRWA